MRRYTVLTSYRRTRYSTGAMNDLGAELKLARAGDGVGVVEQGTVGPAKK